MECDTEWEHSIHILQHLNNQYMLYITLHNNDLQQWNTSLFGSDKAIHTVCVCDIKLMVF